MVLPFDIFGNDRGVPRAAGSGDRPGQIVGGNAGKNDLLPPLPAVHVEIRRRLAQVVGKGSGAADGVEHDVPLRAEDDEKAQPDVRVEVESEHQADRGAEQEVDREGGEELGDRLNGLGPARPEPDPDADRHPDDGRQHHQEEHANEGVSREDEDMKHFVPADLRPDISDREPGGPYCCRQDSENPDRVENSRRLLRLRRASRRREAGKPNRQEADGAKRLEDRAGRRGGSSRCAAAG